MLEWKSREIGGIGFRVCWAEFGVRGLGAENRDEEERGVNSLGLGLGAKDRQLQGT